MTPERLAQLIEQVRMGDMRLSDAAIADIFEALDDLKRAVDYVENDCSPPGSDGSFGELPHGLREPLVALGVLRA